MAETLARQAKMADRPASAVLAARHDLRPDRIGQSKRQVTTIPHQAVVDPGSLRVTATRPGGAIGGVEAGAGWCAPGVQWHPEKLPLAEGAVERPLCEHLVVAARAYARGWRAQGV